MWEGPKQCIHTLVLKAWIMDSICRLDKANKCGQIVANNVIKYSNNLEIIHYFQKVKCLRFFW